MKNLIFKLVLILFLCSGISFGQDYVTNAQKAMKKNDIAGAFNFAKEAFSKDSIDASWRILLSLKEQKNDAELLDLLAQVWVKMKVMVNAISNYEDAEKLDPKNIKRKYILADLYYAENMIKESANKYLEIIKTDSTSKEAYLNVGNIFYKANKQYKADAAFYLEKALRFYDDIKIFKNCAKAFYQTNNYAKAFEVSERGLEKYPNELDLRKIAWETSVPLKKYEAALKHVMMIPDSVLTSAEAKTAGDVANVLKNNEMNIKYYNLAAAKDPNNKDLFVKLADNAYNEKDFDKAIDFYDRKLAGDPKHEQSLQFKAYSYFQKMDYNKARGAFLDWINVSDTSVTAFIYLADCYEKVDSVSKKNETYIKILKMVEGKEKQYANQIIAISYYFVERYRKVRDWNSANVYLKKILSLKEDFNALVILGSNYYNVKDYDNALIYYRRAQKINPNHEDVKKGLRMLSAD